MAFERFTAVVGANIREFQSRIQVVQGEIRRLANEAVVRIGANIREFVSSMTRVRAIYSTVRASIRDIAIRADLTRFNLAMAQLRARMLALANSDIVIKIKAQYDNVKKFFGELKQGYQAGQAMMGKIATSMRNFGELVGTSLQGAFMSVLPAISPILANVGALIGNLGVMIGVMAGQATAFVFGAATAFAGFGASLALVIGNVKQLYDKNTKLNALQKETKSAIDGIKTTFDGLVKLTQKPILEGVKTGAQTASSLLKQLQPLFVSSANAFKQLMSTLKQSLGTPPVKQFLDYLNKEGAPMLTTFAKAAGNLLKGLGSMFVAFAPLTKTVSQGFLEMTQSFAKWAQGLQKSEKFKSFISYVQANMPKISSIFGNAIVGVVNFFSAFSGSASSMMTSLQSLMQRWRAWSAALGENQAFQNFLNYVKATAPSVMALIGNLTTFLVNLGIGLAPLGAKILELANKFLQWTNNMMKSNPVIGQIIAVLVSLTGAVMAVLPWILTFGTMFIRIIPTITRFATSVSSIMPKIKSLGTTILNVARLALPWLLRGFALLTGPIGIAIGAIALVVAALIRVYQTSAVFRNQISTAFNAVKEVVVTAFGAVKDFILTTWESIKSIWTSNSAQIQTIGSTVWTVIQTIVTTAMTIISTVITNAMSVITTIFSTAWPLISMIIKNAWEVIKGVVTIGVALIKGIITVFLSVLTGDWSRAWEAIKNTVTTIWNAIKSAATSIFNNLKASILTVWNNIKANASTAWNSIKAVIIAVITVLRAGITSGINAIRSVVSSVWNAIRSVSTSVWNAIRSVITSVVNAIKSRVTSTFSALRSSVSSIFSAIRTVASSIWNAIRSVISSVVTSIKSKVTSTFSAMRSSVASITSAIRSVVSSGFNAMRSVISSIMSSIRSVVSSAWNGIRSVVSSAVSSVRSVVSSGFNALKSVVTSAMSNVISAIKNGWNNAVNFLKGINLTSIGQHIIQGLINGIKSKIGAVVSAAKAIADRVKNTIKSAMDIHSPSRVTKTLGEHTGQGFANGIKSKTSTVEKSAKAVAAAAKKSFSDGMKGLDLKLSAGTISTASYVKQAKALGQKYKSVTNAQNTVNAKIAKATTKKALATQRARNAKVIADQKAFNLKLAKYDNQYNASKKTTSDTNKYVAKVSTLAKQYKQNEVIQNKANAKIISAEKNVAANLLSTRKNTVSKLLSSNKILTDKQLQSISKLAKEYPKNSKERIYFENQYTKAVKQNAKLQYEANKTKVENILANEKLSTAQQIAKINEISKQYKKGSAERAYFDEQASKKKKEIYDGLIALNEKYTNAIQDANQKLIDGEKALNAEYEKAVADRAKTLSGFTSLFSEVQKTADVTSTQLKSNLQDQVTTLKEWASNINSLASKGVAGSLLEELQQLGPNASSEIAALNTMSEAELKEYIALWEEKSKFATDVATAELVGLRKDTDEQITALRAETAKQLAQYNAEWQAEIKSLTGQTTDKFNALTASMPAIGRNVIKGMQNGLTSMTPALLAQAKAIADAIKSTIQSALDIHSPSRWGDKFIGRNLVLGMINGISRMKNQAVATALDLAESVKSEMASGLSVATGLGTVSEMKSSISKELQVKVKVELDGNGSAGGNSVVIHNQYDTRHLSEAELARQQKRQMQSLGLKF